MELMVSTSILAQLGRFTQYWVKSRPFPGGNYRVEYVRYSIGDHPMGRSRTRIVGRLFWHWIGGVGSHFPGPRLGTRSSSRGLIATRVSRTMRKLGATSRSWEPYK